jgi:type IV secretion system protein VirB11
MVSGQTKSADSLSKASALNHFLLPLKAYFDDPAVTEICINKPGEVWTETRDGWTCYEAKDLTFAFCEQLTRLMATFSDQHVGEKNSILSVTLPHGERCQVVVPPAALPGTVSFTIRKPSSVDISLEMYEESGAFASVIEARTELRPHQRQLLDLKQQHKYREFIELAVSSHQNIIISGATGSGKTTFAKAIITSVSTDERLISIENVDELKLRRTHPNSVAMFYSAGGQGLSSVTPQSLMQSSLRQKPDRVFLAELISGNEAFYFMDTVSSGHPGSISTMHSETPAMCVERLISLIRRSDDGRAMSTEDIRRMIHMCIDVIIQFKVVNKRRCVTEIYYDPACKNAYLG